MQSIKYAFRFISRSFQLAKENEALQKPWMVQSLGSFALMLLWFLPLALVIALIGFTPIGLILIGVITVLLVISWELWGEITASGFCKTFDTLIRHGEIDPDADSDSSIFQDNWVDIFLFTLLLPGALLLSTIRRLFLKAGSKQPGWIEQHLLIQPVIVLEDLDFAGAAARVEEMAGQHLLRFRVGLIRVNLIARIVQWQMLVLGFAVGLWVSTLISDPMTASPWQLILGTGIGLLIITVFGLFGYGFSTFTRACYHTSLFRWVRNVEAAKLSGDHSEAQPPVILAQALGRVKES